jgi:glutaminase
MGASIGKCVASPILNYPENLHRKYARVQAGTVASYIPELVTANPDWFGINIATIDVHVYEVGDTRQPFTFQSISKPLVYGLALEDRGQDAVLNTIGVEPTGDAFNSIGLAPETGCPLNPMINAGAIAATSLVAVHSDADKLNRIRAVLSLYAGRPLEVDLVAYRSERDTGHRNRAIGHMLRNFAILSEDPEFILNLYFQQCSIRVTCRDLGVIASSLTNVGVNPVTGERAVSPEVVENILSVMMTCGMYDYAGEWVYRIGLPAKSGVAGGILAVLPGQLGIGVFSPPLDARGNSVRGVRVCEALSRDLHLHSLHPPRPSVSAGRSQYSLATVRSKRHRTESEGRILDAHGTRIKVYELQGDLRFSAVEVIIREIVEASADLTVAIVDLRRGTPIDPAAGHMLVELVRSLGVLDKHLFFTHVQSHPQFRRFLEEVKSRDAGTRVTTFLDLDPALEWCETFLITQFAPAHGALAVVRLSDHHLCQGLNEADVAYLEEVMARERFNPGDLIIRQGEAAGKLYFLLSGEVSVIVELPTGRLKRLSTVSPGRGFGELTIVEGGVRSADVRADTPVECYTLTKNVFGQLGDTHAELKSGLLQNLLRMVTQTTHRLTEEVMVLEG